VQSTRIPPRLLVRTKFNAYLLTYAIHALFRRGFKSFFTFSILSLITFLMASVLMIAHAFKYELSLTLDALPELTIQNLQGGRHRNISLEHLDALLDIHGVQSALPRVWGFYYFDNAGVNFSLVGIDAFDKQTKAHLEAMVKDFDFERFSTTPSMVVGEGVKHILMANYYDTYFNFITSEGHFKKVSLAGVFDAKTSLESNDMIFMPQNIVRELFDIPSTEATDILLRVATQEEIPTIITKIKALYPSSRVITKEAMKVSYQNIFDYKSGLFLALFVVCIATFFMIVYDRASGLSSEEKKEVGILKAVGWQIDDILKEKFYEAFIISVGAFLSALIGALFFVYTLEAPLLRDIFTGYSVLKPTFTLPFVLDVQSICLIFFLSVPIYIAAILIPSWKAATLDADEVMR